MAQLYAECGIWQLLSGKPDQATTSYAVARSSHSSAMVSIFAFDAGLWA
jgi:hypothetical protein